MNTFAKLYATEVTLLNPLKKLVCRPQNPANGFGRRRDRRPAVLLACWIVFAIGCQPEGPSTAGTSKPPAASSSSSADNGARSRAANDPAVASQSSTSVVGGATGQEAQSGGQETQSGGQETQSGGQAAQQDVETSADSSNPPSSAAVTQDPGKTNPPPAPPASGANPARQDVTPPVQGEQTNKEGNSSQAKDNKSIDGKDLPFEYQKLLEQSRNPVTSELPELPAGFTRLDPEQEIWINAKEKQVLLGGKICFREGVLEMFACMRNSKEHESIVSVNAKSSMLHAGLLSVGVEPGHPVVWDPDYRAATGAKIGIEVMWLDADKKLQQRRAQEMIMNSKTNKILDLDWVFGGSSFWKDPEDNKEYYRGDSGDMICVSNFASATLDLPIESSNSNDFLLYRANTEKIPPIETRVYLLLKPLPEKK